MARSGHYSGIINPPTLHIKQEPSGFNSLKVVCDCQIGLIKGRTLTVSSWLEGQQVPMVASLSSRCSLLYPYYFLSIYYFLIVFVFDWYCCRSSSSVSCSPRRFVTLAQGGYQDVWPPLGRFTLKCLLWPVWWGKKNTWTIILLSPKVDVLHSSDISAPALQYV